MTTLDTRPGTALAGRTELTVRPRYEGSNICSWIGFKHVNYLVEEAVLEHFHAAGWGARLLYEEYALGLDLVDIDTRILHAFHIGDTATASVVPARRPREGRVTLSVTITVDRDGDTLKAVTSTVQVVLRRDSRSDDAAETPQELVPFVVDRLGQDRAIGALPVPGAAVTAAPSAQRGVTSRVDPTLSALTADSNSFAWRWRMPYFYCHFTERVQMSGYLRVMEEVVDLFLADRGISIKTLLDRQDWIPVVPHSSISVLGEALMEEELITVFTVTDIFKDFTYTARMDCYVERDGELVQTATGSITHGYAVIHDRRNWSLVAFDEPMLAGLRGA